MQFTQLGKKAKKNAHKNYIPLYKHMPLRSEWFVNQRTSIDRTKLNDQFNLNIVYSDSY